MGKRAIMITTTVVVVLFLFLLISEANITGLATKILKVEPDTDVNIEKPIFTGFSNAGLIFLIALLGLLFVVANIKKKSFK